ncbi:MAG: DNA repair protein RadC [Akkermansia sp.]|nr:DNA repair protein RadC [Akkermansia sp.]
MEPAPTLTCRLSDLPAEELPREKLLTAGRAALSDEELLALFLRTGLPGCNVLELATRLKRAAGSLAALGSMEAADIARLHKGVGRAKAATLAAVFELGQRAAREQVERRAIRTAEDVYNLLVGELRYETQEVMIVLLLDTKRMLMRCERVAAGTLSRLLVHPRNIFAPVFQNHAAKIIIAHNHPSGDVSPSAQDDELTRTLKQAADVLCIPLLDHVIIGAPTASQPRPYYSYAEHKKLT